MAITSIDSTNYPRRHRNAIRLLTAIVATNAAVFVALRLCAAISAPATEAAIGFLALPSSAQAATHAPWTALTYMFTQYDAMHIILNMLWLGWFGLLLADSGASARALGATYLAGGLAAAAGYLAVARGASEGILIGSSGAVMAIVAAAATSIPRTRIDLPLLRPVSVAVAAAVIVLIDIVCMGYGTLESHVAHISGVAAGAIAGLVMSRTRRRNAAMNPAQADRSQLPELLRKLRTSGYDSLTPAERALLITLTENSKNQSNPSQQ